MVVKNSRLDRYVSVGKVCCGVFPLVSRSSLTRQCGVVSRGGMVSSGLDAVPDQLWGLKFREAPSSVKDGSHGHRRACTNVVSMPERASLVCGHCLSEDASKLK